MSSSQVSRSTPHIPSMEPTASRDISSCGATPAALTRDNWAGNQRSTPQALVQPTSIGDLQRAVIRAAAEHRGPCVVRGSMHSWSPIAVQEKGTAIDLSAMVQAPRIDTAARTVTVSGAAKLADVYDALDASGLTLPFVPTIDAITAAGAAATDSHGAHRTSGHFIDQVTALKLIDGLGRNILIDAEGVWNLTSSGKEALLVGGGALQQARQHMGTLGAVYELTLACIPAHSLELVQQARSESEAFGKDYETLKSYLDAHEHADFFWFRPWSRVLLRAYDTTTEERAPRSWFGRVVVDGFLRSDIGSLAIKAANYMPLLTPAVSLTAGLTFVGTTVLRDRSDRIETYLPGHVQQNVHFQTMEYSVPYARMAEALDIVREQTSGLFVTPVPMYVRRVGDRLYFEFIWPAGYEGGVEAAKALESRLVTTFGGDAMPHPGKLYFQNPWIRLPESQRNTFSSLKTVLDPTNLFTNEFMRAYFSGQPDLSDYMHQT